MAANFDHELFEKILCYNALTDGNYLASLLPYVKPDYFKDKSIRFTIDLLCEHYKKYDKTPNTSEIKLYLDTPDKKDHFKAVLNSFGALDKTYDSTFLITNTETFLKEKAVYHNLVQTNLDMQEGKIDTNKILQNFEQACSISLMNDLGLDYLSDIDYLCKELTRESSYLSTGWKWLDEKLGGGLLETGRALYTFYGQTNVGKSIFLGNLAGNVLSQGKTVVLISLEMSELMYAKRITANLSKVGLSDIVTQISVVKESLNKYKLKHNNAKLIIKEFPPSTVTPLQIKLYIQQLKQQGINPDLIVIDYLNLLAYMNVSMGMYEGNKRNTELVRALSYVFGCPTISATQTNRAGVNTGEMPGLEATSESMGISHTSDVQMPIWVREEDKELNIINLGITKNRFGPRDCYTPLELCPRTLTLKELGNQTITQIVKNMQDSSGVLGTLDAIDRLAAVDS